jgi:ATP-dependent DNA ligase
MFISGVVVEIKGGEIVESRKFFFFKACRVNNLTVSFAEKFGLECTLRFPAFVRFRPDKGWQDIMTYNDVIKTKSEGLVGKKRKGNDSM